MRRVKLGNSGLEASCLGFGCASLGSRIEAEAGRQALIAAIEAGVTWFDLAPAYGGGRAEALAGPVLARHRDRVQIATKVGLAPPLISGLRAAIGPLGRWAVATLPGLRTVLRRSGVQAARRLPLTPELIRGSLERSLRRLGTDHVDLYALHDAEPEEVAREEVLRALEELRSAGKARALAVASDAALEAACAQGPPFGVIQMTLPPPGAPLDRLERVRLAGLGCITHSVFGTAGALERFGAALAGDAARREEVCAAAGIDDAEAALAALLLGRAFALNPDGVVLASMFSERSRTQNLAVAAAPPPAASDVLDRLAGAI